MTTRPGTEICSEVDITNLKVEKLKVDDIISILSKLDKSSEIEELPSIIINNEQLQETLVSPILVNLLYVCYPYLDTVPESVVDFYDKLFITLLVAMIKLRTLIERNILQLVSLTQTRYLMLSALIALIKAY
ncbi:hypothetical protein [Vibrio fluvialis]|uniref:hypothetical protein n=1 Tax=Vibrio fluvialis TaxID=676 RepID=UPI001267DF82|nr:hypothetical protein [Vibrio fluvialis]